MMSYGTEWGCGRGGQEPGPTYQQSRHRRRSPTRAVVVPKLIHVLAVSRCKLKKHTRYYSSRVSAREDSAEPEQAIRPILRM